MRRILSKILLASFLAGAFMPAWVGAQEPLAPELADGADVRIIVDISGSMKDNDPDNLRQPAVRLLARLLPEGASAGVWTFGQYVNMLVPYDPVDDAWRELAIDRSADINSVALRTNLGEAIKVASDDYFTKGDLGGTDFILLTDGKVDVSDNAEANRQERERILGPVLDQLVRKGATFHTVALSDEADREFLETLADRTGGSYNVAPSANALNLAFLDALNAAVPQEQLPIEGDGFDVDSGVQEFTALIFWGEDETSATRKLELTDPAGSVAVVGDTGKGMRWAREPGYDLITVTEPLPGKWRINGELGEGSRVTVVSDLRMVVSPVPPSFSEAQPLALQIAFFEDEKKLTDPDFLGVLEVRVTVTSEDNRSGTKVLSSGQPPANGLYSDTIGALPAAGRYTIEVVADGQTFSRKFSGVSRFEMPEAVAPSAPDDSLLSAGDDVAAPESREPAGQPASRQVAELEPESEPSGGGPIDISEVEEPSSIEEARPRPAPAESEEPGAPTWLLVVAALGAVVVAGGGLFLMYRRKKASEPSGDPGRGVVDDIDRHDETVPVVEPEAISEQVPEPEPEPEPEPVPEPKQEPEPEAEATDVATADDSDDGIPVAEPLNEAEEELPDVEDGEDETVDEFGLEDFDLSEFDDLPDFDDQKKGQLENDEPDKPEPKR
ncbi:MAG: VWA domain-containing protein [Marinobacter sp.]|nr:VWA domain-containing protein [Marinobacter sp.]